MLTYSGVHIMPGNLEAPAPEDLAVQMSRICQFAGAVWWPLLAHSVLVGEFAWHMMKTWSTEKKLSTWAWALLHDAHEVVTGDIPRGWKTDGMRVCQRDLDARIQSRYKIDANTVSFDLVKHADRRAIQVQGFLLELPNFVRVEENSLGHPFSKPDPVERKLFENISNSSLRYVVFPHDQLEATSCMTHAFRAIEDGELKRARVQVEGWLPPLEIPESLKGGAGAPNA